ncbi:receptor-type tyrosine-protein phosphatase H-like [Homalodisca vitripennis]|uniref:receptor-type tyrosine-protein phosphatase H-like n=1 Tax=Homalodisca vitripennis TaxID=197043 RepID=UPI001EEB1983|nr:receptor-type tyrosine-protein phosphatase H-like [Homalodisca vitripennis]
MYSLKAKYIMDYWNWVFIILVSHEAVSGTQCEPSGVGNITVTKVTPDSLTVVWQEPTSAPHCTRGYKLVLSQHKEFKKQRNETIDGSQRTYTFTGLNQCTHYYISVEAIPNSDSQSNPAPVKPYEIGSTSSYTSVISKATVKDLTIESVSEDQITISWKPIDHCLNVDYEVNVTNTNLFTITKHLSVDITGLDPCTTYEIYVTVLFRGILRLQPSAITARTLPGDRVVELLNVKAGWNSLQLDWKLPDIYRNNCVTEYVVQVCSFSDCLDAVTVHDMSYYVSNLSVCTLYTASVVVKLSETKLSSRNSTVTQLTKSAEPQQSELFYPVKVTTNTVEFEWQVLNMSSECAAKFVLSTMSTNGSIIAKQKLDYTYRKYTVLDLKPCQNYSFELKLVDENGSSTIDYNAVNVVTRASEYPFAALAIVLAPIILAIAITGAISFILWRICREACVIIKQFLQHTENVLSSPGLLKTEFNIFESESNQYPQVIGKLEQNKGKNRYCNIYPYDVTRVILKGDHKDDYINASHIKLQEAKPVNYIACQAPTATTCGDFWKMIFQFRVNLIVMLCMQFELEREGFIYYPRLKEVVMYDNIVITCYKEEEFSNYIVRTILADKAGVLLKVKQFLFIGWPEFGVPESPDVMVKFVNAVQRMSKRKKGKKHYMVVHCCAGVGRTGTFIALDALMRLIKKWNCTLNIFDIVQKIRKQRCCMVQTEVQYKYIYECMKYALENHTSFLVKVRKPGVSNRKDLVPLKDL